VLGWPYVFANYWVFLGSAACLLAIAALGLTVLVGWAGEVCLAGAALVGTGVYITGFAIREDGWGLPFLPGALIGVAVTTALALLVSLPTARLSGIYVMVLTLGMQVTIERTVFTSSKLTGGPDGVFTSRPEFLGISFESDRSYYYLVLAVMGVVLLVLASLRASRHGRAMMLVKTDRRAASAVGVSPWRYKILAFAIVGILAGVAGALTAPLYRSPPTLLQYLSIPSLLFLAVPVTAGFESLLAVVVVAFVFTMTPQALESLGTSPFLIGGIGLVAGTLVGPRGLGGYVLDLLRRPAAADARRRPAASQAGASAQPSRPAARPALDRTAVRSRPSVPTNGHRRPIRLGPPPNGIDGAISLAPRPGRGPNGNGQAEGSAVPRLGIPPRTFQRTGAHQ
jgi:ABC-type branched-subunit amino acid transport system permease subunit